MASRNISAVSGAFLITVEIAIATAILTIIILSLDSYTTKLIILENSGILYKLVIIQANVYLWMYFSLKAYPLRDSIAISWYIPAYFILSIT